MGDTDLFSIQNDALGGKMKPKSKPKCRRCKQIKPIEIFGYCKECANTLGGKHGIHRTAKL